MLNWGSCDLCVALQGLMTILTSHKFRRTHARRFVYILNHPLLEFERKQGRDLSKVGPRVVGREMGAQIMEYTFHTARKHGYTAQKTR